MLVRVDIEGNVLFNKIHGVLLFTCLSSFSVLLCDIHGLGAHRNGLGVCPEDLCTKQLSPQHDVLLHSLGYRLRLFDYQKKLGQGYRVRADTFTTFNA